MSDPTRVKVEQKQIQASLDAAVIEDLCVGFLFATSDSSRQMEKRGVLRTKQRNRLNMAHMAVRYYHFCAAVAHARDCLITKGIPLLHKKWQHKTKLLTRCLNTELLFPKDRFGVIWSHQRPTMNTMQ